MKRFLIAVLLLFTMTVSAFAVSAEEMGGSNIAYEELLTAWSSDGLDMYPDYVGGMYFGDDGMLVVALSDNTEENHSKVLSLTSAPDSVKFTDASFSYNELNNTLSEINDNVDTDVYNFDIQNIFINEETNCIEITLGEDGFSEASDRLTSDYGSKISVSAESEIDIFNEQDEYTEDISDDQDLDYEGDSGNTENYSEDAFFAFSALNSEWANAGYAMYPPYVGGVYFAENGNLVIALCDDNESNRNAILSIAGSPNAIEFKTVSYSYDELYSIQEEIGENYNNNSYDFLVNFYSVSEEENVVEIRVASSELEVASRYFKSIYGDKVVVLGGYDTEEDTGFEDDSDNGPSASEKIRSTSSLRLYISIGIIAIALLAVLALTFLPGLQTSTQKKRYRK